MEHKDINSISWKEIGLCLLPGLILILQNSNIWKSTPRIFFILNPFLFLIVMILILIITIRKERGLSNLSLPAIGGLIWETNFILFGFINLVDTSLVDLFLFTLTIISSFVLYNSRKKFSKTMWWSLLGFTIILLSISSLGISKPANWFTFFTTEMFSWIIKIVPIFALGLLLTRKELLTMYLLVAVIEPVWIESYLIPNGVDFQTWNSSAIEIKIALALFHLLPPLIFLVVLPLIELLSKIHYGKVWSALISLTGVGVIVYLHVGFLQNPNIAYIFPNVLLWLFFVLILWTPILLSLVMYPSK